MEELTRLLNTMYSQVDKVPEHIMVMDLFTDKMDRYSALIYDIAKMNSVALRALHVRKAGTIESEGGEGMYNFFF